MTSPPAAAVVDESMLVLQGELLEALADELTAGLPALDPLLELASRRLDASHATLLTLRHDEHHPVAAHPTPEAEDRWLPPRTWLERWQHDGTARCQTLEPTDGVGEPCHVLVHPLAHRGERVGLLLFARSAGEPVFDTGSLRALSPFARLLAAHLYRPWIQRELQQKADQLDSLLAMLDELGIAYFRCDTQGVTVRSSDAESRITGYPRDELEAGFERSRLYFDAGDRLRFARQTRELAGSLNRKLHKLRRSDGSAFWAEGDMRLIRNAEGNEVGFEGLYKDVSDRIALQGFLDLGDDEVLEGQQLIERLTDNITFSLQYQASLSHQLLAPLHALAGTLERLAGRLGEGDHKLETSLRYLRGQMRICALLVQNSAFLSTVLHGEPFRPQRVAVAKLVIETKLDFAAILEQKKLDLVIERDSLERYLEVQGHPELLRQVLLNLIDNAIKYSVDHSRIIVRGHHWPQGRILEISNRGLSIAASERESVFERGFRSRKARMHVPQGMGVGLWLVRKILAVQNATIRCLEAEESNKRRTLFRITFPH